MNQIEVENLAVKKGDASILKGIEFSAKQGEFVAIVGGSGSGKTTFLQALAGFIPFSGKVIMPENKGMIFQQYAAFPWLTVRENIMFGLDKHAPEQREKIVAEHIRLSRLEGKENDYPGQLSGGQIQRVALARSLAHDPEVLLMDEPYGALDAYTRDQMQEWLMDVWTKYKKTIIFVTHNIEEAIFMADRVLVLKEGKFTEEFKIEFKRPRKEEIKFMEEFNRMKKEIYRAI